MQNWYEQTFWDEIDNEVKALLKSNDIKTKLQSFSDSYSKIDDAWLDAYLRICQDSNNKTASTQLEFIEEKVIPRFEKVFAELKQQYLDQHEHPLYLNRIGQIFHADLEPYVEINTELNTQERALIRDFQELRSNMVVHYQGEKSTWEAWNLIERTSEQTVRAEIYQKIIEARLECAPAISEILFKLIKIRKQQASNAGFESYPSYIWPLRRRNNFSYQQNLDWSISLARTFASSYKKYSEKIKDLQQVSQAYVWDLPPEIPTAKSIEEADFKTAIRAAFAAIDSEFASIIDQMEAAGDLDIMHHKDKSGGNFAYGFKLGGRVGVSGNTIGSFSDIPVLLHECGHAIHYHFSNDQSLTWDQEVSSEISEFIAYLFQCLASEHLESIGFIPSHYAHLYRLSVADSILDTFRGVAERDLFEQRIYSEDLSSTSQLGSIFQEVHLDPPYNEGAFKDYASYRWQTYPTIVSKPFSGIEFSLAWLCTLLVIKKFKEEKDELITQLKILMRKGNSIDLKESLALLGINLPFTQQDFKSAKSIFEETFLNNL